MQFIISTSSFFHSLFCDIIYIRFIQNEHVWCRNRQCSRIRHHHNINNNIYLSYMKTVDLAFNSNATSVMLCCGWRCCSVFIYRYLTIRWLISMCVLVFFLQRIFSLLRLILCHKTHFGKWTIDRIIILHCFVTFVLGCAYGISPSPPLPSFLINAEYYYKCNQMENWLNRLFFSWFMFYYAYLCRQKFWQEKKTNI